MAAAAVLIPCPHFWKGEERSDQKGGEAPTREIQSRLWMSHGPLPLLTAREVWRAGIGFPKENQSNCLPARNVSSPPPTPSLFFFSFYHISFFYLLPVWDRTGSVAWVEGYCRSHPTIFPHPPVSVNALNFIICELNYHPYMSKCIYLLERKSAPYFISVINTLPSP